MLEVFGGGLERLVSSLAKPAAGRVSEAPVANGTESSADILRMAGDADHTLVAGRTSSLSLEPSVTLEGIASTLGRIYSAQVA